IDAKPLPVSRNSKDKEAAYGYAESGMGKGYKLHAIADDSDRWREGKEKVFFFGTDEHRLFTKDNGTYCKIYTVDQISVGDW
ncbi:MAG: hypothetical protein ACYSUB_21260, partial [Planctomycetota bacterium]